MAIVPIIRLISEMVVEDPIVSAIIGGSLAVLINLVIMMISRNLDKT